MPLMANFAYFAPGRSDSVPGDFQLHDNFLMMQPGHSTPTPLLMHLEHAKLDWISEGGNYGFILSRFSQTCRLMTKEVKIFQKWLEVLRKLSIIVAPVNREYVIDKKEVVSKSKLYKVGYPGGACDWWL